MNFNNLSEFAYASYANARPYPLKYAFSISGTTKTGSNLRYTLTNLLTSVGKTRKPLGPSIYDYSRVS
jgi:hypothetical protein